MAKLYYAEHVHVVWTWTPIPPVYFCVGQESESKSGPESVSGNVNELLRIVSDTATCNGSQRKMTNFSLCFVATWDFIIQPVIAIKRQISLASSVGNHSEGVLA